MSDDMEYIDASSIDIPVRRRKPKYKHKLWESENPKDYARYLLAASRNYRRHVTRKGEAYDEREDPFLVQVTDRNRYEIECESVFRIDPATVDLEVNELQDGIGDDELEMVVEMNQFIEDVQTTIDDSESWHAMGFCDDENESSLQRAAMFLTYRSEGFNYLHDLKNASDLAYYYWECYDQLSDMAKATILEKPEAIVQRIAKIADLIDNELKEED